ncbi:DUF6318 family protein [Georgenia sp. MJ206]|uniref:DUF6318 family protein n=1 Tax=Georgenia wangjunii TaxID=3117730 RepID=UPI002F25F837
MAGRTRRGARAIVVLAIVAVLGVGCSNDATPSPTASGPEPTTPQASEAPSATPSPGPTDWPAPERPASMDRDDVVGAKAAAQYFIELYPYVYATGDLDEWRAMSHSECEFCASVVENVEALHAQDGYALGGEVEVTAVSGADPAEGSNYYSVELAVEQGPGAEYRADGEELRSDDGGSNQLRYAVERTKERWLVRAVDVQDAD